MKKLVTAMVVGVAMTIMSVVPCFAGIDFACDNVSSESVSATNDVAPAVVAQPTVVQPTATVVTQPTVTNATIAQQAQLMTTNYVVALFYNGDINAASADMSTFMGYYNACYPNVLQALQLQQK